MTMLIIAGAALGYAGLAALSVTIDRHYADLHGRGQSPDPRMRRAYRIVGWLGLAFSFATCIGAHGWHTGPVLWCGMLSAAAMLLTWLLQFRPRLALRLAHGAYPLALALAGCALLLAAI